MYNSVIPDAFGICFIILYFIGTVGAGSCLYDHIYIHNKRYSHAKNKFYFWFQEWCFRVTQNVSVSPKFIYRLLKQLPDVASTIKDLVLLLFLQLIILLVLFSYVILLFAFSALTLLVGCQEEHPACKN